MMGFARGWKVYAGGIQPKIAFDEAVVWDMQN